MHFIYLDDSKDPTHLGFSALCIPADTWQDSLTHLIGMRRQLKLSDGIYTGIELHATDWLGGRGNVAPQTVHKGTRARLFFYVLSSFAMLPGAVLLNAFGRPRDEKILFERLLNRIEVFLRKAGSQAILISDEGKSFDSLLRRMRRFNYIQSRFGDWGDGREAKNMPLKLVLEDLVYRDSKRSLFIQAADFCAFSLLRSEAPTEALEKNKISTAFKLLEPLCIKQAYAADPRRLGIIRAG